MLVPGLIERKRDGGALTPEEWAGLIAAYATDRLPDYQMASLLMAVVLNGLEPDEVGALTDAVRHSGQRLGRTSFARPRVDSHSTGGVGDKAPLVLAPLVASLGLAVPMIAGRALGFAGGTVDKLEAIPGFRTAWSVEEARDQVERVGCAIIAPSDDIAPAAGKLDALRDVTGTVESVPLIAAGMMGSKLAEDLSGLVLDIKRGRGAFVPDLEDGLALAQMSIRLGASRGCRTVALVTAMDRPLGHACGNALEVEEAIAALHGEGPDDLKAVTMALAVEIQIVAGVTANRAHARAAAERALASGDAARKFAQIVEAQGGNPAIVDDPAGLPQAPREAVFTAPKAGIVNRVVPRAIGQAVVAMGGGRNARGVTIDPAVGIVITAKPGDPVERGQPLATVYARDDAGLTIGREALDHAVQIFHEMGEPPLPLVSHRVTDGGVEILE